MTVSQDDSNLGRGESLLSKLVNGVLDLFGG